MEKSDKTMVFRRNGVGLNFITVVVVLSLAIYGYYSYHQLHTRFVKAQGMSESLSAQLQGNYVTSLFALTRITLS